MPRRRQKYCRVSSVINSMLKVGVSYTVSLSKLLWTCTVDIIPGFGTGDGCTGAYFFGKMRLAIHQEVSA